MKARKVDFDLDRIVTAGNTCVFKLNFNDGTTAKTPVSQTGEDFFYTMKESKSDTDANALVQIDPAAVVIQNSGASGGVDDQVVITLTGTHTDQAAGEYYQDIKNIDGSVVLTIGAGVMTINTGVTLRTS